jgi:hypothetical protein
MRTGSLPRRGISKGIVRWRSGGCSWSTLVPPAIGRLSTCAFSTRDDNAVCRDQAVSYSRVSQSQVQASNVWIPYAHGNRCQAEKREAG